MPEPHECCECAKAAEEDAKYWRGKANHETARLVAAEARIAELDEQHYLVVQIANENAERAVVAEARIANALAIVGGATYQDRGQTWPEEVHRALTAGTGQ